MEMDPKTRAEYARNILTNPAYAEAVGIVRKAYTERMINTAMDDQKSRDKYYLAIHALADIQTALTIFLETGKIETSQALKKEKAKNVARDKPKGTS